MQGFVGSEGDLSSLLLLFTCQVLHCLPHADMEQCHDLTHLLISKGIPGGNIPVPGS